MLHDGWPALLTVTDYSRGARGRLRGHEGPRDLDWARDDASPACMCVCVCVYMSVCVCVCVCMSLYMYECVNV